MYIENMDIDKVKKLFAERLKMARAKQGVSQIELAKMLGVSKQSILNWENKTLRDMPKVETIFEMAEKLEVTFVFLMGDKIKEVPQQ
jgi:transcriptional regulator with XRE-family HTH domain